jgi:hypothetical protein
MINDLTDLEPLLAQYDPGKVLIGPLLNLSINSSFRFFYIAGNGPKIYESISVGFVELETDAQKQRADIVARLESRFGEVQILGSQLELAQAVHSLWPNEETTRFLGTSALEAKLQPKSLAGREEGFDNGSDVGEPFSDRGQQVVEKTVPDSLAHADAIDPGLTNAPPSHRDQAQPTAALRPAPLKLPNANASWPLNCDPTPQQRHAALKRDDIALAVLELKSPPGTVARLPVEGDMLVEGDMPVEGDRSSASIIYRLCAFGGAAVLFAGMVVLTSTRQIADEAPPVAAQLITANRDNDSSQTAKAVTQSIPPNKIAKTKDAAPQTKPAPLPPSQAPETARAQAEAAPVSGPQSPPSPTASAQVETVTGSIARAHPVPGLQSAPPQAANPDVGVPRSPPSHGANAQATATPDRSSSKAPEAPRTQIDAAPISQPQLPQLPAETAQVGTVHDGPHSLQSQGATPQFGASPDIRAPEALRAQAGAAAPVSAPPAGGPDSPQSLPSQMARTQAVPSDVSAAQPSPSQIASAQPREAPVSQPPSMKTQTTASSLSADEIAALLSRSDDFLKHGDFAAARILLRRAAESGSANAALVLGKSFDPLFLHELGAIGIQPDIAQSRQWYEKAAELGSEAAAQRLANLAQTGQ